MWLKVMGCGLALSLFGVGCASGPRVRTSEALPLTRVVLYRSGIGYFERQGAFDGDELVFRVRRDDVGDFLTSLTAVDRGEGRVETASFELEEPDPDPTLRPALEASGAERVGRSYETIVLPPRYPDRPRESKDPKHVDVRLRLGGDDHNMTVAYVIGSPIWRSSYRLVVSDDRALLQAWTVIHNQTGEDWSDVRLSLTTGAPIAFQSDLEVPKTPQRPRVTDDGEVIYAVPTSETSLDSASRTKRAASGRGARSRDGQGPDRAPGRAVAPSREMGVDEEDLQQGQLEAASIEVGDVAQSVLQAASVQTRPDGVTRYDISSRVTVPDGSSTMVVLLSQPVSGELAHFFAPEGGVPGSHRHPFRVARLVNSTGAALERGPITVLADGDFVGQGVLSALTQDATAFVPFALDRSAVVESRAEHDQRQGRLIRVIRDRVVVERIAARKTHYEVRNGGDQAIRVYLRHTPWAGAKMVHPPAGIVRVRDHVLVPVQVPAHAERALVLEERTPGRTTVSFASSAGKEAVALYLEGAAVDAAYGPALRTALAIQERLASIQQQLSDAQKQRSELQTSAEETRENLKAIEKIATAGDLRERLVRRMSELDRQIADLTQKLVTLRTSESEVKVRLEEALRDVRLEVPDESDGVARSAGDPAQ